MASPDRPATTAARNHAVVIGAGVAGLTAARALSDTCARVTVIDRDALPGAPAARRGVPQSRHLHVLLARGARALDELFPGFLAELTAAGASHADTQGDASWYLDGHLLRRAPSGLVSYGASRPLVEHRVRARTAALDGVGIMESAEVLGPVTTPDRRRITGVRVRPRAGGAEESVLPADLVVDASGRGSRAPAWLEELGHPRPATSEVRADVVYVTRHFRREPHHLDGRSGAAIVPSPGLPRGGAVLLVEDGRFAVVLIGQFGEEPPTDHEGMLAYAESLPGPDAGGRRKPVDGLLDGYLTRYRAAASVDPVLGRTFLSVAHMVEPPARLMAPGHVLRVLRASRRAAPGRRTLPRPRR